MINEDKGEIWKKEKIDFFRNDKLFLLYPPFEKYQRVEKC